MRKLSEDRIGELFLLVEVLIFSFFPVIANYTTRLMPPILFVGLSTLIAGIAYFLYYLLLGKLRILKNWQAFKYIMGVTVFIAVIPSIFIYLGTSMTSGVNTTMLVQTEIVATFVVVSLLKHEKVTSTQVVSGLLIMFGAAVIVYNGSWHLNIGDLLIVAGTLFYPFGNIYAQKALKITTPVAIMLIRSLIGGVALIIISLIFENYTQTIASYAQFNWEMLMINGILIYCISKLFWYEGLKRHNISKSIIIGMSHPAFSLLFVYLFLHEVPTVYQWTGFALVVMGMFVITKQKKVIVDAATVAVQGQG